MNKKELRDKFFKEHTYKCENGIPRVLTHPHNLFEWMYKQLTITVVSNMFVADDMLGFAEHCRLTGKQCTYQELDNWKQ